MMDGGGLDGMTGLIPLVITAGIVQKITERSFPSEDRGGKRLGSMQGEQERYEPKRRTEMKKKTGMKSKGLYGGMGSGKFNMSGYGGMGGMGGGKRKKRSGVNNPSGLTSMMKKEGSKVKQSVAYEGHKLGSGSMGSLPGVGKVTPGKVSSIGIGGNKIYDAAKHSMKARTLGKL